MCSELHPWANLVPRPHDLVCAALAERIMTQEVPLGDLRTQARKEVQPAPTEAGSCGTGRHDHSDHRRKTDRTMQKLPVTGAFSDDGPAMVLRSIPLKRSIHS